MAVLDEAVPLEDGDGFAESEAFASEGFDSDDFDDSFAPESLPARLSVR